jgi:hypothetical protein
MMVPKTAIWQRIFWKRAKKLGVKNTVFTPFPEESPLFYPKNHFFTPSQISPLKKPFFALLKHGFLEEAKKKAKKEAIRTPRLVECILRLDGGGVSKSGKGLFVFFACQTRLNERNFAQKRDKDSVLNNISLKIRLRIMVAGFSVPKFLSFRRF